MRIFSTKIFLKNLLAMLFLVILFRSNAAAREYYVYVAAESEDEVALVKFDEKHATLAKRILVGVWPVEIEGPHGITVSPDGQTWYLSIAHGRPFGYVYKFKTGTDEMVGRVQLGLFPATMQISPATGLLYVVNFNLHGDHVPSTVSVVDPESMEEIQRIQTGVMPHGSRLSPDGLKHYSVAMMDDELFEIDALTMEVSRRLNVAGAPPAGNTGMANLQNTQHVKPRAKPTWATPHPKKPLVYVANNGANEIVEVDLKTWKVTRRFPTAPGPYNLDVSADGKKLVVSYKTDGSTGVWDLKKGVELAKIANSRKVTHGVVIAPDSRYAFVSVEGKGGEPGAVDVFDLKKLKRVATANVGKQAGGIAFWKIEGK